MNRSLFDSLKRGGRLAIIDFEPEPGSRRPDGVPINRGGHGITPRAVEEEITSAGFIFDRMILRWPSPEGGYFLMLFRKP